MPVRTTVYLDDRLAGRARRVVAPRKLNKLINEALEEKVAELERAALVSAMKKGYIATRDDRDELARDWEAVDLENWPE